MVRLHLKAEQMAIEIFARTKPFRDADRKLRKARLDELLKNTRNWVKPEITRWFTDNQINTRGLSPVVEESFVNYLAGWVEQTAIIHPFLSQQHEGT